MVTIQTIRNRKEYVLERLLVKNFDAKELVENIIDLDEKRRGTQQQTDNLSAQQNQISKEIGQLFAQGKNEEAEVKKLKSIQLKEDGKTESDKLAVIEKEIHDLLVQLPNLPNEQVPTGKSAEDNVIVRQGGEIPVLIADSKPHWELATKYDIINFELGNKITGAGFPVYKNKGAKLQRALISFFLENATAAGFIEYQPPILVNAETGFATGQLPDKDSQMYFINEDGYYLIPTAEVPVTNIYRNVILKEGDLPIRMTAYTPCFRREAGSYGKDVRGLNRLHQFDKVEIVRIEHPDNSYAVLEEMVNYVEGLLQKLNLPYRILKLCGGDMSFTSALTYDFEVFSAGQNKWLEVSSVSNFETFQSNRMNLRFKDKKGKMQLCHTLNGSALALPRIVASLLENNQTEKGILIPGALRPYTGFDKID